MKYLIVLISAFLVISCTSDNTTSENFATLNFTEIYSIQADTLEMDMISNTNANSLFITYSADNGYNENLLKLNPTTLIASEIIYPDLTESREIEIIGNELYSVSSNNIVKFDLNLNITNSLDYLGNNRYYPRTIGYNGNIQIPGGLNNILEFDTGSNSYNSTLAVTMFPTKNRMDGEIINNTMYAFGGAEYSTLTASSTNEIEIYNFTTNIWTTQTLPFSVFESFTDVHNGLIIVGGNKLTNHNQGFIGVYDPVTGTYSNYSSSLNLNNISIRGLAVLNNVLYVAYADFSAPMPTLINIKIAKATLP